MKGARVRPVRLEHDREARAQPGGVREAHDRARPHFTREMFDNVLSTGRTRKAKDDRGTRASEALAAHDMATCSECMSGTLCPEADRLLSHATGEDKRGLFPG